MNTAERNVFIHKKADEFEGQGDFVIELAKSLSAEGFSEGRLRELLFGMTTPQERDICTPYLEAIESVMKQRKKQRRNQPVAANP